MGGSGQALVGSGIQNGACQVWIVGSRQDDQHASWNTRAQFLACAGVTILKSQVQQDDVKLKHPAEGDGLSRVLGIAHVKSGIKHGAVQRPACIRVAIDDQNPGLCLHKSSIRRAS